MPFYTGDWMKAPEVRALPPDYRGLWIDCLCFMWESTERGVLVKPNGKPYARDEIIRMVGLDNQGSEFWLTYLIDNEVCSVRESDGAVYSRRMVKDERIRKIRKMSGKKGGNPNLVNQNSTFAYPNVQPNGNQNTENENENEIEEKNINCSSFSAPRFGSGSGPLGQELHDKAVTIAKAVNTFRVKHGLDPQRELLDGTEDAVKAILRSEGKMPIDDVLKAADKQPPLWKLGLLDLDWLCKRSEFGDYNYRRVLNYKWQTIEDKPRGRLR